MNLTPSLDLILAPMYAGKTSELIRRLIIFHEMEMKVLYINSNKDVRSKESFSTHNPTVGKIPFDNIKSENLKSIDVSKYDVLAVDEASFFDDLKETVLSWVEERKKIVLVAGLNGDFQRKPFGQINDLVPYCDTISKLTPFCFTCKKEKNIVTNALFTKRIVSSNEKILIGDKDFYIPVCRECFLKN